MSVALAFEVVLQGLKLWNTKEARALYDKVFNLRLEWEKEYNKPVMPPGLKSIKVDYEKYRNNAKLDDIELQLNIIARTYINQSKQS